MRASVASARAAPHRVRPIGLKGTCTRLAAEGNASARSGRRSFDEELARLEDAQATRHVNARRARRSTVTRSGRRGGPATLAAHYDRWGATDAHSYGELELELPAGGIKVDCDHDGVHVGDVVYAEARQRRQAPAVAVLENDGLDQVEQPVFFSPLLSMRGDGIDRSDTYIATRAGRADRFQPHVPDGAARRLPLTVRGGRAISAKLRPLLKVAVHLAKQRPAARPCARAHRNRPASRDARRTRITDEGRERLLQRRDLTQTEQMIALQKYDCRRPSGPIRTVRQAASCASKLGRKPAWLSQEGPVLCRPAQRRPRSAAVPVRGSGVIRLDER